MEKKVERERVESGECEPVERERVESGVSEPVESERVESGVSEPVESERVESGECEPAERERVESGVSEPVESGVRADQVSIEAMVAEAEMRGYLRGRNESIEELMKKPGEPASKPLAPNPGLPPAGGTADILRRMRESIWDRGK